jgi:hypothetical protein
MDLPQARWWAFRPARNEKAATYTCPLCDGRLHAMSEHALIAPEGDLSRRRHAHTECVQKAHAAGKLPTHDEWRAKQPGQQGPLGRIRRRRSP